LQRRRGGDRGQARHLAGGAGSVGQVDRAVNPSPPLTGTRRVRVDVSPAHEVIIGDGLLAAAADLVPERHVAIVSDENVGPLLAGRRGPALDQAGRRVTMLTVPAGESSKQIATWSQLLEALATSGLDRHGAVLALGGGVVGDLAGFAAASYLRGVAFYQ